ncbi:acyl-CoA dehydrogenase [Solimonas sp. K1W22B-7]|uniref:acyl-CoA dehydrogenase family protein n=1 Tax=Solimonas sp. K1W22B-7 TaxID=2303331 RepID=UPI000E336B79|nr:acyl-CoA dehydrogenase [Solimonas sp. K1W22B-7]
MGFGLKILNRIGGSSMLDDPKTRKTATALLKGATSTGFRLIGTVNRQFKSAPRPNKALRPGAGSPELFDLTPTDEQQMVRDTVAGFAAEQLRPAAQASDTACETPKALLAAVAELGIGSMQVPEALGGVAGSERSVVTNALIAEALAHGDLGMAVACLAPVGVAVALAEWGTAQQQASYLPSFTDEKAPAATIAVLEPRPLFDPFKLSTAARRTDAGGYILSGEKSLVPIAASAELFLVAASTTHGPALFIVESGTKGIHISAEPAMGLRAAATARVRFDNVQLSASALLGGGEGDFSYENFIARSRLAWCALAVGTAQAALDYLVPYCNERIAFGEPISHRQAVAFNLSNIAIEGDGMRLLTWRAAALAAAGKPFVREAALARRLCADKGSVIGADAVQLLGGHGFVKEHPVERWYRDLRAVAIMEGGVLL